MAIKLKNISYGDKLLDNINCTIKENSITTIMGKSGSGKTLLIEIIAALEKGTGIIEYNGSNKIGIVFQNSEEQFFANTVEKEIGFGLNYTNKNIDDIHNRILDALKMVGLSGTYLKRKISSLSSGEKRKVAIASILADNPKVLILDEPTIGLDMLSKKSLIKILKLLKTRYHKTIIMISKDSDFVHNITDEIIILDNGEIVLSGNKYDVFTKDVEKYGLKKPKIIQFESIVYERKHIKLLYRDDINDLMKDVYRHVK